MIILHIAKIGINPCDGVDVVVPQYLRVQQPYAEAGLLNLSGEAVGPGFRQLPYEKPFALSKLPAPFDKPDIAVFHEVYHADYAAIARQLTAAGIPYVILPHACLTSDAQKKKKWKKSLANTLYFRAFLQNARALQFLSPVEREKTLCVKKEGFVATNGCELPTECKSAFHKDAIDIVFIGRLDVFAKGLDIMAEAVTLAADAMGKNNAVLSVYGPDKDGRFEQVMQLTAPLRERGLVRVHHEITGEDKRRRLLEADIFLQTSRNEGMPGGVLEALSLGVPCLVTEGTNLAQPVAESGAGWAAETTAESVAAAIEKALSERACWPLRSQNARRLAETRFGWDAIARETVAKYAELLTEKETP